MKIYNLICRYFDAIYFDGLFSSRQKAEAYIISDTLDRLEDPECVILEENWSITEIDLEKSLDTALASNKSLDGYEFKQGWALNHSKYRHPSIEDVSEVQAVSKIGVQQLPIEVEKDNIKAVSFISSKHCYQIWIEYRLKELEREREALLKHFNLPTSQSASETS